MLADSDGVRVRGVTNTSSEPFVYLSVTTPPQDFAPAYKGRQTSN
jgi:hypothetical protein